MSNRSLVVILSRGGARLDPAALADLPGVRVVHAEFAVAERAACAALTLEHGADVTAVTPALRAWAAARGWTITIARGERPG